MSSANATIVSIKGVASGSAVASATLSLRSYFSGYHLWAASHFARLADEIEGKHSGRSTHNIRHRVYVISSVVEAVAFLEAVINELFQDAADEHIGYLAALPPAVRASYAAFWDETDEGMTKLLAKYQIALVIAGKPPLDRGRNPFQDVKLLIRVRNDLIHYRPETVTTAEAHELEKKLQGKFPANKLMSGAGNRGFDQILGAGCARWAVDTAKAFADETFGRLGIQPNYQVVKWDELP